MSMPAARIGDMHTCPMQTPAVPSPIPHVGGPISAGCPTVLIGNMPAARQGDMCVCVGPPDTIAMGSATVLIGNMPAARLGDATVHGGVITVGCPTVLIGMAGVVSPVVVPPVVVAVTQKTGEKKSGAKEARSGSSEGRETQDSNAEASPGSPAREPINIQATQSNRSVNEETQAGNLQSASDEGEAFCEECEKLRQQRQAEEGSAPQPDAPESGASQQESPEGGGMESGGYVDYDAD